MIGIVQRAFELAPQSMSIDEIRAKLMREGYASIDAHLQGGSLRKDLKKLLRRG